MGMENILYTGGYNQYNPYMSDLFTLQSIGNSSRDAIDATTQSAQANLQQTSDASRDNLRETSRVGSDLSSDIGDLRAAVERANGESRLQSAISSGEIRSRIDLASSAILMGQKDIQTAVLEQGCKGRETTLIDGSRTREESARQFAELQLQQCKDHAQTLAEIKETKYDLSRQIAECCCEQKALIISENAATRQLIQEQQAADLRQENLLLKMRRNGD